MADSGHFVAFEQVSVVFENLMDNIITFLRGKSNVLKDTGDACLQLSTHILYLKVYLKHRFPVVTVNFPDKLDQSLLFGSTLI